MLGKQIYKYYHSVYSGCVQNQHRILGQVPKKDMIKMLTVWKSIIGEDMGVKIGLLIIPSS